MVEKQLEFRGIHMNELKEYVKQLGGKQQTNEQFDGDKWTVEFLSEEELTFTPAFKVNAVKLVFRAENKVVLDELIKSFRKKTLRIGG